MRVEEGDAEIEERRIRVFLRRGARLRVVVVVRDDGDLERRRGRGVLVDEVDVGQSIGERGFDEWVFRGIAASIMRSVFFQRNINTSKPPRMKL